MRNFAMTNCNLNLSQFLMIGLPGFVLDDETLLNITNCGICNFILFKRNVLHHNQLKLLCTQLKEACKNAGLPPPIIAVDQEGGEVQRLGPPRWPKLISNREVGRQLNPISEAQRQATEAALALKDCGIPLNLAPVLDIYRGSQETLLQERSYGSDERLVADCGTAYIGTLQSHGIAATAKHFPGIGSVTTDPHHTRPVVPAELSLESELLPFIEAIDTNVAAMMTSHVVYEALDSGVPATFSYKIAHELLRERLGFKGILLTDDLEMGGIHTMDHITDAGIRAFQAGHDLLLVCHHQDQALDIIAALELELKQGRIPLERIAESARRLQRFRERYCSDDHAQNERLDTEDPAS
jgi:beta-N-acetylhexosaminidase